nr:PREDICTED: synapsin-1-like [Equus przewalskii]
MNQGPKQVSAQRTTSHPSPSRKSELRPLSKHLLPPGSATFRPSRAGRRGRSPPRGGRRRRRLPKALPARRSRLSGPGPPRLRPSSPRPAPRLSVPLSRTAAHLGRWDPLAVASVAGTDFRDPRGGERRAPKARPRARHGTTPAFGPRRRTAPGQVTRSPRFYSSKIMNKVVLNSEAAT